MPFFDNDKITTGDKIGKSTKSLSESRKIRGKFIQKYGLVPSSILLNERKQDKAVKKLSRTYDDFDYSKRTNKKVLKTFNISGNGCASGVLSTFPQNIGRIIIQFYCPDNGIVYDPFAGHNSRMELCYKQNLHYVGCDISQEFMRNNRLRAKELEDENVIIKSTGSIKLIEGSSSKVDLPDNYANFTITSPPYYDIEYYGDEPEQLGKNKTYDDFLDSISLHIKENYRILKNDSFCCWNVNDFTKKNKFYPYHCDILNIFKNVGFEVFNVYIVDLGRTLGERFIQSIIKTKRFPKRHEYFLIFKK